MLKIISMFKFDPEKPFDECRAYWMDVHSTVVPRCLPTCRRYVQNVPVPVRSQEWQYHGISELWFDDMDAIRAAYKGPLADELRADELKFGDANGSHWIIVTEREIVGFGQGSAPSAAEIA